MATSLILPRRPAAPSGTERACQPPRPSQPEADRDDMNRARRRIRPVRYRGETAIFRGES
jgi:hypothetical protein